MQASSCRHVSVPKRLTWPVHPPPSIDQRGSLLHSDLTVLQQLVQVSFVILGSVVCRAVQRVSDLHLLYLLHLKTESRILVQTSSKDIQDMIVMNYLL